MRERHLEIVIYIGLFILLSGFFRLQVMKGDHYQLMSESNRIRTIPIVSARGRIYDRNNIALAENKPMLNVSLIPDDFNFEYVDKISEIINLDPISLRKELEAKVFSGKGSKPILVKKDINMTAVYRLEELSTLMGGVHISKDSIRHYPEENLASHIVGYIGKINRKEYEENKHRGWLINESIGRIGIEKTFNDHLMGKPGGEQVEVDAKGQQIQVLSKKEPVIGKDVYLTIDVRFQEKILNIIDQEQNAAVCVIDVNTGDIISLLSTPTFDPNIFVNPTYSERRMPVLQDERSPVVNRTISYLYSPGSVFKVLIGLAALQEGLVDHRTTYVCTGEYQLSERSRSFRCWNEEGHGPVNLYDSIRQSCNIYFYRVGLRLGNERIAKYARFFGFGEEIDLGLPYSKSGLVPDAFWKLKKLKDRWYPGETMVYSIGQGFLQVTPLQIAKMIAAVANGGRLVEPNVIRGKSIPAKKISINREHFNFMRQCMLAAIESAEGTAQLAKPSFLQMAGKTGTAQTRGEPHSWYGGFFPYNNPQIAIVVMVEHGGPGGGTAAVYAGQIADEWLLYTKKKSRMEPKSLEELVGSDTVIR